MPRISRLNRDQVSGESLAIYDRVLRDRGNVPNMFRTLAHRPQIFQTIIAHMEAVLKTGTLSTALKELCIVRTSQLNCTASCLASHTWAGPTSRSPRCPMRRTPACSRNARRLQSISPKR
jgi:alkylhydroperoxidase family enzyme